MRPVMVSRFGPDGHLPPTVPVRDRYGMRTERRTSAASSGDVGLM